MTEIQKDTSMSDPRERYFILRNHNNPVCKISFAGNDYAVPPGDTHQDALKTLWGVDDEKLVRQIAEAACGRLSGRFSDGSPMVVEMVWGRREEEAEPEPPKKAKKGKEE